MADDPADRPDVPAFWCDAMCGGLARWLRAAGYDAAWQEGIDDAELVRRALVSGRVLLTSDTGILERGAVRSGRVRALLVPHGRDKIAQLRFVLGSLGLGLLEPRCMACGGRLAAIPKEAARPEAPPKTFGWCEEFFRCDRCAKLFWRGTHWTKIETKLRSL